jgi:hypothetical protein
VESDIAPTRNISFGICQYGHGTTHSTGVMMMIMIIGQQRGRSHLADYPIIQTRNGRPPPQPAYFTQKKKFIPWRMSRRSME